MRNITFILLFFFSALIVNGKEKCSVEEYMRSQSLYWEQLPYQWNEGAFVGNGILGMVAYVDSTENSITFWLGRADVTDHRKAPDKKTSMGVSGASVMSDFCRLDIGKMKVVPDGKILSGHFIQDIYNGEITGDIKTEHGNLKFTAYTPRDYEVNIVEIDYKSGLRCMYHAARPYSPRFQAYPEQRKMFNYSDNYEPIVSENTYGGECVYKMLAGGDYAVSWKYDKETSVIYVSAANETPKSGLSLLKAQENINKVKETGLSRVKEQMNNWWHKYWDISMINIPDKQIENFYNIQMYKLAVNSTPDGPAIDNMGVLYKTTQWPGIWWNLNIQLTYMSTIGTNRMEQSQNFLRLMDDYFMDVMNASGIAKTGDYTWALHTYYSILRYSGCSWTEIERRVMPKLKAVITRYRSTLKLENNVYNLLQTESPEYEGFKKYDNSNYNLGLFRWALKTAVLIYDKNDMHSQDIKEWTEIADRLHDYPVDENGFMIASDKPLNKSHRHYSHLLSFYPLKLHDMDNVETCSILRKSLKHWQGIDEGKELAGYSYTGGASLYALLGDGDSAYANIKRFLNSSIGISLLLPNTLYVETNGKNPVIETPLSAATAISEMLLQSNNGVIYIFPAIPSEWNECSFKGLRSEGGFVISSSMKNKKIEWIEVSADVSGECVFDVGEWENVFCINKDIEIKRIGKNKISIELNKGDKVYLSDDPDCVPMLETPKAIEKSYYGLKKGKELKSIMDWPE